MSGSTQNLNFFQIVPFNISEALLIRNRC